MPSEPSVPASTTPVQDYADRPAPGATKDHLVIPRSLAQSMPLRWQQVFVVLLLSTVVGALVGVGVSVARRGTLQTRLPFGVFLAVAAYAASVVGEPILEWYLGLMAV